MKTTAHGLETSLPRNAYVSAEFFAREQRAIFWDQWFYAGRSQDYNTRDFRVIDVAGESIFILRDDSGELAAFYNFCRHRGTRLLCGEGRLRGAIRCPYHSWVYALDGRVVSTPFIELEAIPETAKRLHRVAVDEWGGFIFVHLSPERMERDGEPLPGQLGRIPGRLVRYPLAELQVAKSIRYDVAANWKVLLENYNECYHCAGVHPELCRVVPAFKKHGGADLDWEHGIPHREDAHTFTASGTTRRAPFPALNDTERVRHNGELIYPNFMLSLAADHVAAFRLLPSGPGSTTVVCDFLFHPDEIAKSDFDPSDAVDFWDVINKQDWKICERVQLGMSSHRFDFGYYAPMEDASLDIRRYIAQRLGDS